MDKTQEWIDVEKDERGIPLEDVVVLSSFINDAYYKVRKPFFIGSFSNHDAVRHQEFLMSSGAVFTAYQESWTDAQRIISILCDTIQAMHNEPSLTAEDVVRELRKIDFFFCGAFPQIPGDHRWFDEACNEQNTSSIGGQSVY